MKRLSLISLAVLAAMNLHGETLAESADVTFRLYLAEDSVYSLTNAADVATWKVTWQEGETVDATAMDGTETTLSDGAVATSATLPSKGGVWRLSNSEGGTATVCIPWTVYNDGGEFGISALPFGAFFVDMVQDGPNRKLKKSETPPVAYSGDDWAGDLSKAATLTFTPPDGGEAQTPTLDPAGTGVKSFTFNKSGDWTVTLTFADGTTKTAIITIEKAGFIIIVK